MSPGSVRLVSGVGAVLAAVAMVLAIASRTGTAPADRPGLPPARPLQPPVAPAAGAARVEFAPTADGAHTAWLVAGPFDKALAAPEKVPEAVEGQLLEGCAWKLLPWPSPAVELSAKGGLFYASGALIAPEGGRREIVVRSLGPVRVWLDGRSAGASNQDHFRGVYSATVPVDLKPGANRLLLECNGAGGRTGFALFLVEPAAGPRAAFGGEKPASERLALTLRDASPLRLGALLAGALALRAVDVWTAPDKPVALRLERTSSAPRLDAELELRLLAKPDALAAPGDRPQVRRVAAGELLAGPLTVSLPAPAESCLALECAVELAEPSSGRALARFSCLLYSREGLADAARKLLAGSLLGGPAAPARNSALALAHLKGEKALLFLSALAPGEAEARAALDELSAGREALAAAAKDRDPLAGQVGWLERAYWCPADSSAQPFRLYVPRQLADPAERQGGALPMIVYLHGWVPTYDKHAWVEEAQMRDFCELAERLGAVLLVPFGRSNTDFASIGEVDVLRAIDETCRLYPVDRDRVSLCGYSMGGYGAFNIAAHFPDRFASLVVLSGRPIPYYAEQRGRRGQPRYKGFCLDVDAPMLLAGNMRNLPVRVFHNQGEFIPIENTQAMVEQLKAAGAGVEFTALKGDHWSGWGALVSPETIGWMLDQRRPKRPAKVTVRMLSPRYGRSYWAEVGLIDKWTALAELTAEDDGKGTIRVSARNVREFSLYGVPGTARIAGTEQFEVERLGADQAAASTVHAVLKSAPKPGQWVKGAQLSGPMKEACNGPFVVAWGSAGSAEETADNEAKARRFAEEWQRFAKGAPQTVDEKTLTEAEKTTRSVILFGAPETSRLAREAEGLKALECRLTAKSFEIAGRKVSLEGDRGVVLTRPNPWCPAKDRYLVICAGRYYGDDADHPASNHKLDLIPDFIVFTAGSEGEGEPPALLAGYFDSDWKADPALIEEFAPKTPLPAGAGE